MNLQRDGLPSMISMQVCASSASLLRNLRSLTLTYVSRDIASLMSFIVAIWLLRTKQLSLIISRP